MSFEMRGAKRGRLRRQSGVGVVRWAALLLAACAFAADPPRGWIQGTIIQIEEGYRDTGATVSANGGSINQRGFRYLDYSIRSGSREYVFRVAARGTGGSIGWLLRNTVGVGAPQGKMPEIPMAIGDAITFAVQGSKGWVLDGNRKEYAATVVRQSLLVVPQPQPADANRRPTTDTESADIPQAERPTLRAEEQLAWAAGRITDSSSPRILPDARRYTDYVVAIAGRSYILREYLSADQKPLVAGILVSVAIGDRRAWIQDGAGKIALEVMAEN